MLREAGKKAEALAQLDDALQWLPRSAELIITRAEWLWEEGKREEALAEADRIFEASDESGATLFLHAQFMQNAGQFAPAVDDWKKILRHSEVSGEPSLATAQNGLAYAQALAEQELDDALQNVNRALEREPENAAILDTRAYIDYLQAKSLPTDEANSRLTDALQKMDIAVKSMDRSLAQIGPSNTGEPKVVLRARDARPKALRDMDSNLANLIRSNAVMHYHRALILEALQRKKEAQAERAVVERLIGRPPDKMLF